MTDRYSMPSDATPAPLPLDAPAPVPLGVPVKKRSRWPIVVAVVIALLLCGGCYAGFRAFTTAVDEIVGSEGVEAVVTLSPAWEGSTLVGWSGEGRYAVIQTFLAGGLPQVIVVDTTSGEERTEAGYVVVAVESEGAQIWLEPAEEVFDEFDGFSDAIDHKPARLMAWRLDGDEGPTDDVSAKWRAWPGPGDYTAYLEVDPLKGCMPAKLLINNKAGSGEGVKAALPETTRTYAPIGWSVSGEYFAIEELLDGDGTGLLEGEAGASENAPDRSVLIFSASTGELVAEAVLPKGVARVPSAAWGINDALYWADLDDAVPDEIGMYQPSIESLSVHGSAQQMTIGNEDMYGAWSVMTLGGDLEGALMYTDDGRLWRVGPQGVQHWGNLEYTESAVWDQRGGLLTSRTEWEYVDEHDAMFSVVYVCSQFGGRELRIWRGPEVESGIDVGF